MDCVPDSVILRESGESRNTCSKEKTTPPSAVLTLTHKYFGVAEKTWNLLKKVVYVNGVSKRMDKKTWAMSEFGKAELGDARLTKDWYQ